ncbi:EF-hand domain-containing protein [Hankyongella ginsenosidimutans]|uniref:EF-hand domain-containing protein n=1 Tax=Hankyongella ginsenosidimutans TaxID=1763828 RepID=A0A4D7C8V3_9SPHN|nr:EF-hand domain-containing protein [Hankyongella ginsenosidimutans]QCI79968.1 EF-hand domain-containing protein [Hankyongella ginsenosidimutans]TXG83294.1 MAG: EF-hand domain-containing protein [Sphingomonadales bacterium]
MNARLRWVAGGLAAVLVAAAVIVWRQAPSVAQQAAPEHPLDAAPVTAPPERTQLPEPTREQKRLARYDKDKDGVVSRDEYLASRRKAFAKLDRDGDGRLSFEEYAVKTSDRFAQADSSRDGRLSAAEFATTARKPTPRKPDCAAKPDEEA